MSDRDELTRLTEAAFQEFSDAEVILIVLALNSGARFRADGIMDAGLAKKMTEVAVDMVVLELQRREIDVNSYASRLMATLLEKMPAGLVS